jgi:hypothetical protein
MGEDEKFTAWYMKAIPWKGCPFDLQLVVITDKGKDDAKRIFKKLYQNDSIEITDCHEISLIKADDFDKAERPN